MTRYKRKLEMPSQLSGKIGSKRSYLLGSRIPLMIRMARAISPEMEKIILEMVIHQRKRAFGGERIRNGYHTSNGIGRDTFKCQGNSGRDTSRTIYHGIIGHKGYSG